MNCSCIIPVGSKASSPPFESFQSHGKWRNSPSFSVDGLARDGHRVIRGTYFCMSWSYWIVLASFKLVVRQASQLLNHSNPMAIGGVLRIFFRLRSCAASDGHRVIPGTYFCMSFSWWIVPASFQWAARQASQLLESVQSIGKWQSSVHFCSKDLRSQWRPPRSFVTF